MNNIFENAKIKYVLKVLTIIFVIVLMYSVFYFVRVISSKLTKTYEVGEGELAKKYNYTGYIYRNEIVYNALCDGYVNFFVSDNELIEKGKLVCTISNDLNDTENIKETVFSNFAGIISFEIDGYENEAIVDYDVSKIKNYATKTDFNKKTKVNVGEAVYKIVRSPDYYIAFDGYDDYDLESNLKTVNVVFPNENIETKGQLTKFIDSKNNTHFAIRLIDYLDKFLSSRVVNFQIVDKKISGYIIPVSSIVTKECYCIPKNIVIVNEDTKEVFVNKLLDDNINQKILLNIIKDDEDYYYIPIDDKNSKLDFGDVLQGDDGNSYLLSESKTFDGVYNMNRGYAMFKNIDIIDKIGDYAVVNKNSSAGVSLYDHIALYASKIKE